MYPYFSTLIMTWKLIQGQVSQHDALEIYISWRLAILYFKNEKHTTGVSIKREPYTSNNKNLISYMYDTHIIMKITPLLKNYLQL